MSQSTNFLWQGGLLVVAGITMTLFTRRLKPQMGENPPAAVAATLPAAA